MSTNVLKAILNIISAESMDYAEVPEQTVVNRVIEQGRALETFIRDAFSGSFQLSKEEKQEKYYANFSYLGSANQPPDLMIANGDVIEVKKTGSLNSDIHLNSSHPKHKAYHTDSRISKNCKDAENWEEKDMLYCIGTVPKNKAIRALWMIYGDCFAATKEVYENLSEDVSSAIADSGLQSEDTNELAKFDMVDPLGITILRVRGMWMLKHPNKIFQAQAGIERSSDFDIRALMLVDKYESLPQEDRRRIEDLANISNALTKANIRIPNPNNPAQPLDAVLISYTIDT